MDPATEEHSSRSTQTEIERRWQSLDPIFIMGMQRTGTSIVWRALQAAGFLGFPEGHLWFELVEPFARFRNPAHRESVRHEAFTLGSGRNLSLEQRFALTMDRFHRDLLPSDLARWVDKSPGPYPVRVAPMLGELFPRAQFIFMQRNPIATVNSAIAQYPHIFEVTCEKWVSVMRTWRQVRPLLVGRYLKVPQEHIVKEPRQIADQVATFLNVPDAAHQIAEVFRSRRENTSFPDRSVDDFFYPVDWTDEQKTTLAEICGEEMSSWGYPLDFQHPGGPDPAQIEDLESEPMDAVAYYRWLERPDDDRIHQLERELARHKALLARISQGRVMRLLNRLDGFLGRLGLQ